MWLSVHMNENAAYKQKALQVKLLQSLEAFIHARNEFEPFTIECRPTIMLN